MRRAPPRGRGVASRNAARACRGQACGACLPAAAVAGGEDAINGCGVLAILGLEVGAAVELEGELLGDGGLWRLEAHREDDEVAWPLLRAVWVFWKSGGVGGSVWAYTRGGQGRARNESRGDGRSEGAVKARERAAFTFSEPSISTSLPLSTRMLTVLIDVSLPSLPWKPLERMEYSLKRQPRPTGAGKCVEGKGAGKGKQEESKGAGGKQGGRRGQEGAGGGHEGAPRGEGRAARVRRRRIARTARRSLRATCALQCQQGERRRRRRRRRTGGGGIGLGGGAGRGPGGGVGRGWGVGPCVRGTTPLRWATPRRRRRPFGVTRARRKPRVRPLHVRGFLVAIVRAVNARPCWPRVLRRARVGRAREELKVDE